MTAQTIPAIPPLETTGGLTPEKLRGFPGLAGTDDEKAALIINDLAVFSGLIYQILAPSVNISQ
jgi:hypothetical protein